MSTTKTKTPSSQKVNSPIGKGETKTRWLGYFNSKDDAKLKKFQKKNNLNSNARTLEILVRIGLNHQSDYNSI